MDNTQLNDLKQFIAEVFFQAFSGLATKNDIANMATKDDIEELNQNINKLDLKLSQKIDDLDLKVDTISDTLNDHLNEHDVRITKLEQQTA